MSLHREAPPGFFSDRRYECNDMSSIDSYFARDPFVNTMDEDLGRNIASFGVNDGSCYTSPTTVVSKRSNSRSGHRLFVRISESKSAVSRMPSREVVIEYFSGFGQIIDCYLPESATNVAYLCFDDASSIDNALFVETHTLEGGYVFDVSRAAPRPDYSINTDRVFVKNVPISATRQDLKVYFSIFGEVTDVYIPKDKATGTQKRFAFVTFKEVRMAKSALALDEHYFPDGSLMQVMPAETRPSLPFGKPQKYDQVSPNLSATSSPQFNFVASGRRSRGSSAGSQFLQQFLSQDDVSSTSSFSSSSPQMTAPPRQQLLLQPSLLPLPAPAIPFGSSDKDPKLFENLANELQSLQSFLASADDDSAFSRLWRD